MASETWLDDLREEYARGLPARVGDLRSFLHALSTRPGDPVALHDLAHHLHRLVGSAGSYGFPEISTRLSPWSRLLISASSAGRTVSPEDISDLRDCIDDLAAHLRSMMVSDGPAACGPASDAAAPSTRVAVIEDNLDNMLLVRALLQDRYVILEHEDGRQALENLRKESPDLVLLDISLPGIDGTEIMRRLRQDPQLSGTPVIALTAHAMAGDRERFLAVGFDDHVTKPILDESVLIEAIERCLRSR